MTFKVGDRVRIVCSDKPGRIGIITTVVGIDKFNAGPRSPWYGTVRSGTVGYVLDIPPRKGFRSVMYPATHLEPVDDDQDSWDEIEKITKWNPHRISA